MEPRPGWAGRFFSSESMTFGYYDIIAGSVLESHSHPNEEVWHVLEGRLEVTIGDETRFVEAGGVAIVSPNTQHSVRVHEAGRVIVVDQPRRESLGGVRTV